MTAVSKGFHLTFLVGVLGFQLPPGGLRHRPATRISLNRILVEPEEVTELPDGYCRLAFDDSRVQHVATILKLEDRDTLRFGVLGKGQDDEARIFWVWPEDYSDGWLRSSASEEPPTTDVPTFNTAEPATRKTSGGPSVASIDGRSKASHPSRKRRALKQRVFPEALEIAFHLRPPQLSRPRVDVLLALPRPLQLQRMLPMIASLGVGTLILSNAAKVEADYFGSHLLRDPQRLRGALVEGLAQSGDVHVPDVIVARRLKVFLEDCLDYILPPEASRRVVAHPCKLSGSDAHHSDGETNKGLGSGGQNPMAWQMSDLNPPQAATAGRKSRGNDPRILVAIGPEGGWREPFEIDLLAAHGFSAVSLGPRVLRSDVALNSLLALAHEKVRTWDARIHAERDTQR